MREINPSPSRNCVGITRWNSVRDNTRALQLNRHLQANTERRRDVLSIGRELLKRLDDLPRPVIDLALFTLRHHISKAMPA
jgi:hypothetical protein